MGEAGTTPLSTPALEQRRVVVERRAEPGLVAEEHDDELRGGVELLPVALLPETRHVLADEPRVTGEMAAPRVVVLGLDRVEVGVERCFRVDHEALPARELDHEVGPQQPPLGVVLGSLLLEVAVGDHAGELDDALELHLAPAAAHVRGAQRGHEVPRLLLQPGLALRDGPQLLADAGDRRQPRLLELARLLVEPRQGLFDGRELRLRLLEQRGRAALDRLARRGA